MRSVKWSGALGLILNCFPVGMPGVETIIHKFDLKPGGLGLNEMRWRDNSDLSKIVFQEVAPQEKLVWHHSSSDSDWNIIANPMMPDWPRVILTIVTLEHMGAKTKVRLTWEPFEATDAEIAYFSGAVDNMSGGWESGYVIMDESFVELQAVNT